MKWREIKMIQTEKNIIGNSVLYYNNSIVG